MNKKKLLETLDAVRVTNPKVYKILDQYFDWLMNQERLINGIKRDMKRFVKLSNRHGGA